MPIAAPKCLIPSSVQARRKQFGSGEAKGQRSSLCARPRAKRGIFFGYSYLIPSRKLSRCFSALPPQRLMNCMILITQVIVSLKHVLARLLLLYAAVL